MQWCNDHFRHLLEQAQTRGFSPSLVAFDSWYSSLDNLKSVPGMTVHLRGYGLVKVFRTVDPHGNADYWATSRLDMTEPQRQLLADRAWLVEVYHRAIKQFTRIERAQFRLERSQRNHIGLALRAYLRLEVHRWRMRVSIFNSKLDFIRMAVGFYLAHPKYALLPTA